MPPSPLAGEGREGAVRAYEPEPWAGPLAERVYDGSPSAGVTNAAWANPSVHCERPGGTAPG